MTNGPEDVEPQGYLKRSRVESLYSAMKIARFSIEFCLENF